MACKYHQTTAAINTCKKCGQEICDNCCIPFNGVFLCKDCLAEEVKAHPHASPRMAPPPPPARPIPPSPPPSYRPHEPREPRGRRVNGFFLFCCSALPGANYMYLGLIKKGLFVMSSFFFTIFMMSIFNRVGSLTALLAFACTIIAITSFFDGFSIRRRINYGERVEDSVSDITNFIKRHKTKAVIGGIALVCYGILASIVNMMSYYGLRNILNNMHRLPEIAFHNGYHGYSYAGTGIVSLIPCILIFMVVFFIAKRLICRGRSRKYDTRYDRHESYTTPHDDRNQD